MHFCCFTKLPHRWDLYLSDSQRLSSVKFGVPMIENTLTVHRWQVRRYSVITELYLKLVKIYVPMSISSFVPYYTITFLGLQPTVKHYGAITTWMAKTVYCLALNTSASNTMHAPNTQHDASCFIHQIFFMMWIYKTHVKKLYAWVGVSVNGAQDKWGA